jgi:hypothetical protein
MALSIVSSRRSAACRDPEHEWVEREHPTRFGYQRVRACDTCGTVNVALPGDRPRHDPAHAVPPRT